jgi:hypothetical protein
MGRGTRVNEVEWDSHIVGHLWGDMEPLRPIPRLVEFVIGPE